MTKKPLLALAAGAALALSTWPLIAQPTSGDELRGGEMGRFRPRLLARALDLSDEQTARSRELLQQAIEETKPLREELRSLRAELRRQLEDPQSDDATLSRLARELHGLRSQLTAKREEYLAEFTALLTPVQQERFETLREVRKNLRESRRGGDPAALDGGA